MNKLLAGLCLWLGLLGACVIDPGADETDDEEDDSKCTSNADCENGKVCPAGGEFKQICSTACETDNDCVLRAGDGYYCWRNVCTQVCADTCNFGLKVSSCAGKLRCIAQRQLDGNPSTCDVGWCVP